MRKLNRKHAPYAKQYKNYIYTTLRIQNTINGHPNFEVTIYSNANCMQRFDIMGEVYHISTYDNIDKIIEKFIDERG
jgi:hypothetical protein